MIKKTILILATFFLTLLPTITMAANFNGTTILDWSRETNVFNNLGRPSGSGTEADQVSNQICQAVFSKDPNNLFSTVLCSLIRVVALSVSDFATNTTCTIQQIAISTNYTSGITFTKPPGGNCTMGGTAASLGAPAAPNDLSGNGTGLYVQNWQSVVTNSLTTTPNASGGGLVDSGTTGSASNIPSAFNVVRNLVTALVFIALVGIAIAKIAHVEVNTYSVKKVLPSLAIALIGGWLSIYMVFLLSKFVDYLYRLQIFSPYQSLFPMLNIFGGNINGTSGLFQDVSLVFNVGNLLIGHTSIEYSFVTGILGTIFLTIPAIIVFCFEYLIAMRPFAIGLLTVVSPIAFACMIFPQTQIIFRKWWSFLLIALFFTPIVNFAFFFMNLTKSFAGMSGTASGVTGVAFGALWLFKSLIIVLLIRLPFTIESDLKKITAKISGNEFMASLGLGKSAAKPTKQATTPQLNQTLEKSLSSQAAKGIIAGARPALQKLNVRDMTTPPPKTMSRNLEQTDIRSIVQNANNQNMKRDPSIMAKSVLDLPAEAFKAVVGRSDLQLWKDTRLIEQLKNKDDAKLDDQGAANRVDSIRKLLRFAQVEENGKLMNGDAIKTVAQKGALGTLGAGVIKEALNQGVLTQNDLVPSFGNQTSAIRDRIMTYQGKDSLSLSQAKQLMNIDHQDYLTGFKDIESAIKQGSTSKITDNQKFAQDVLGAIKSTDSKTIERSGMYFLSRLGQINKEAKGAAGSKMQGLGADASSAMALAQNDRVGFDQAKQYLPSEINPSDLEYLQQQFKKRDLSSSMISEISNGIYQEKSFVAKNITDGLATSLKKGESSNLNEIQLKINESIGSLNDKTSPEQAKSIAKEIDKFYPGAILNTDSQFSQDDIARTKERAQTVSEIIEKLKKNGISEDKLKTDPDSATEPVNKEIGQDIQAVVQGQIKDDNNFSSQLQDIAAGPKVV